MSIQTTFDQYRDEILVYGGKPWAEAVAKESVLKVMSEATAGLDDLSEQVVRDQKFYEGIGKLAERNTHQQTKNQLLIRVKKGVRSCFVPTDRGCFAPWLDLFVLNSLVPSITSPLGGNV